MTAAEQSIEIISREDAINQIVDLLQPASQPKEELRKAISAQMSQKSEDDKHFNEFHAPGLHTSKSGHERLQAIAGTIKSARALLECINNLQVEDRIAISNYLQASGHIQVYNLACPLDKLIKAAELQKSKCSPRRSGGAAKARAEMERKKTCAIFAISLLRLYHRQKISRAYKAYLEITGILVEHFEKIPDADVRRACEEMFNFLCAHEQDDR